MNGLNGYNTIGLVPPSTIKVRDGRKVDAINGKAINPNKGLPYDVDMDTAKQIINNAKRSGIDPYTALAISY